MMINRMPRAALVVAALLFGIAPTGTKFALGAFGPVTVLVIELVAASVVLWIMLLCLGYRRPRSGKRVLLLGLLEPGLAYLLFSFGLDLTTASNAALMTGLECGFVVLLAAVFLRERAGTAVIGAGCLAVVGLVVLEGVSTFGAPGIGDLLVSAGVLSAAAYTVVARGLSSTDDSLVTTAHQFAAATALVLPLAVIRWAGGAEPLPTDIAPRFWIAAVLVGILGGAVAFLLYNTVIVRVEAGPAGVIINLAPAFGLVSAVWWLDETLTAQRLVGALIIGLSVALFLLYEGHEPHRPRRLGRAGQTRAAGSVTSIGARGSSASLAAVSARTAARAARSQRPSVPSGSALNTTIRSGGGLPPTASGSPAATADASG